MSSPRRLSAVYELDLMRFGGPTEYHETVVTLSAQGQEILKPNPDRLQYWISNTGPETLFWNTNGNPVSANSHRLGVDAVLVVRATDDGAFVAQRLYGGYTTNPPTIVISWIERSHRA
jgi:hypothetical protein